MNAGFIPGTAGLAHPDPECRVRLSPAPLEEAARLAAVMSSGFGGRNTAVLVGRAA